MASFKDMGGNRWSVDFTGLHLRRVKSALGINIMDIAADDFSLLNKITTDICLMGEILWIVVADQAKDEGISEEDFYKSLLGDVIIDAQEALLESIADFFPNPSQRLGLKKILAKAKLVTTKAEEIANQKMTEALDSLDPDAMAKQLIDSSTKQPVSSE